MAANERGRTMRAVSAPAPAKGAGASNPLLAGLPDPGEGSGSDQPRPSAHGPVCTVGLCPICLLVTAFGEARPELTEHLLLAGREVLLALKVLIDARLQADGSDASTPNGLERIPID